MRVGRLREVGALYYDFCGGSATRLHGMMHSHSQTKRVAGKQNTSLQGLDIKMVAFQSDAHGIRKPSKNTGFTAPGTRNFHLRFRD